MRRNFFYIVRECRHSRTSLSQSRIFQVRIVVCIFVKWNEPFLPALSFSLHTSRYSSSGHWQNKTVGARGSYERSNVYSADKRVARKPNTSEPFYKVNTMEPAKVYSRLNATSYFHLSNPSSFDPSFELPFTFLVHCAQAV